jgi:protein phosphatase 2C
MTQCFKRMDAEVGGFCLEEGDCQADNSRCCPEPIAPETVGTTAIVAVVGACQIIVGNCGDSRAVLSRGGVAIPLSVDHNVCFLRRIILYNFLYLCFCFYLKTF